MIEFNLPFFRTNLLKSPSGIDPINLKFLSTVKLSPFR